jgi:hypothetical protein
MLLPGMSLLLQVGFSWSFTRETLLSCELMELERLLASRQEVLAMLHPLSSTRVARMMALGGMSHPGAFMGLADSAAEQQLANALLQEQHSAELAAQGLAADGSRSSADALTAAQQQELASSDGEDGLGSDTEAAYLGAAADTESCAHRSRHEAAGPGSTRIIQCADVFAGLNLGLADSTVVTLEVGVVEVANLAPRSGWSQDLTHSLLSSAAAGNTRGADSSSAATVLMETAKRSDLPMPVVYVFCGAGGAGDKGFEVRRCLGVRWL